MRSREGLCRLWPSPHTIHPPGPRRLALGDWTQVESRAGAVRPASVQRVSAAAWAKCITVNATPS